MDKFKKIQKKLKISNDYKQHKKGQNIQQL